MVIEALTKNFFRLQRCVQILAIVPTIFEASVAFLVMYARLMSTKFNNGVENCVCGSAECLDPGTWNNGHSVRLNPIHNLLQITTMTSNILQC